MTTRRWIALLLLGWVLGSSCGPTGGGSAGGGGAGGMAGGGIGGTGISFGQITGFGSIVLNDITFDVTGATLTADDDPVSESDLGLGDVCRVEGTFDPASASGTATRVTCNDELEGPVTDLSGVADGVIAVMGQTVRVDVTTPTIFSGFNALTDLVVGNVVEIHGFVDASSGDVFATRIELKTAAFVPGTTDVEIKGTITGFNGIDRFDLGALSVQITPSTDVQVSGGLADGTFVEVKGTLNASADVLTAPRIEDETRNPLADADPGSEAEVEGVVSDFNGLGDFKVNGVPVNALNADLEGGTPADGAKVEVEGSLDASGVLLADKVEIEEESDIRIDANVVGTPTATRLDVGVGPAVLTLMITTRTELRDKSDADLNPLEPTDISAGERVKVRAFQDPVSGDLIATRIEREDADDANDDVKLRGPVEAVADPIVTVAGVDIDTTGITFEDDDDNPINRNDFFNRLNNDPTAEVEVVDDGPPDGTFDTIELKD